MLKEMILKNKTKKRSIKSVAVKVKNRLLNQIGENKKDKKKYIVKSRKQKKGNRFKKVINNILNKFKKKREINNANSKWVNVIKATESGKTYMQISMYWEKN